MKAINLFEATRVLERAKREVLDDENEIDKNALIQQSDIDVMLLEHNKPTQELFPNRNNQAPSSPKVKGNTSLTEVKRFLSL